MLAIIRTPESPKIRPSGKPSTRYKSQVAGRNPKSEVGGPRSEVGGVYSARMPSELNAKEFAADWIAAWNSHDLDAVLSHYSPDVVLTSPVAAKILNDPSGTVRGKAALRNYFKLGLEAYPNL